MRTQIFSLDYHPHIDGQTKIVNNCLQNYILHFTGSKPKEWVKWFSWPWPNGDISYNTGTHESTKLTPYKVVYSCITITSTFSLIVGGCHVEKLPTVFFFLVNDIGGDII